MIIAIFDLIKLKFAALVTVIKKSYESKFQLTFMKTYWEIKKAAQKYTIYPWKSCYDFMK